MNLKPKQYTMNYLTESILPIFYILIITAFVGAIARLIIHILIPEHDNN